MPSSFRSIILGAVLGAASVSAHGHVQSITVGGSTTGGFNPFQHPYQQNPPAVPGWTTTALDNGFVAPDAFANPDIICHLGATPGKSSITVAAGSTLTIQWDTWPESHHGPVIDMLASCGSAGCETVDKTALRFFKIAEKGLIDGSAAPGFWASDELIADGNKWKITIPATLRPGNYVLRHDIIALHSAFDPNGAQAYPQCVNLVVTGSGNELPAGVPGTELYGFSDPGVHFNIYRAMSGYVIPGPAVAEFGADAGSGEEEPRPEPATPVETEPSIPTTTTTTPPPAATTSAEPVVIETPTPTPTPSPLPGVVKPEGPGCRAKRPQRQKHARREEMREQSTRE